MRYLVADTGRWLPHRKVLIAPQALGGIDENERILHVQLTREQVEKSPSIDADKPVSRQFEEEYLRYFGWPFYWADPLMWGATAVAPIPPRKETGGAPPDEAEHRDDPHLRSILEVIGYRIHARDGDIGHLEDFLIEDHDWAIRELVIDTRNWLPGKRVVVSPEWVRRISWEESRIHLGLDRNDIESLPEHHPPETATAQAREQMFEAMAHQPMSYIP